MVTKQCAVCSRYFSGEFDGNYTCDECLRKGAVRQRPLVALGAHTGAWERHEGDPFRQPGLEPCEPGRMSARGQAA